MVDCGEGTQRQLLQLAGPSHERISYHFLTHEHIDHLYGIAGLVYLVLRGRPDKVLTVCGPAPALELSRGLVGLVGAGFMNQLRWVRLKPRDRLDLAHGRCEAFRTYHTETSLGYRFHLEGRIASFLGDVALPDGEAFGDIASAISGSDVLIADAVHIAETDAATLARKAEVKSLYLMPILFGSPAEEVQAKASAIYPNSHIPADLETITI